MNQLGVTVIFSDRAVFIRRCAGAEQPADVVSIAGLLTLQADSNADLLSSPPTPVSADQFALSEEVTPSWRAVIPPWSRGASTPSWCRVRIA
jgi:hypothetical protein